MNSNILVLTADNDSDCFQVKYVDGNFWLTQKRISELFGVRLKVINYYLKNIIDSGVKQRDTTVRLSQNAKMEGERMVTRKISFYRLDVVLLIGAHIKTEKAIQFRCWAADVLSNFIIKGYVFDKERLKNGAAYAQNYFRNLRMDIREIRSSKRYFYQKITDLLALSIDYEKDSKMARTFYSTIKNKLFWAITSMTSAEIVYYYADCHKEHMGLTFWKNAPDGKIEKSDIIMAKNYMSKKDVDALNSLTTTYLDMAENLAEKEIPFTMDSWIRLLNIILKITGRPILEKPERVSSLEAEIKVKAEYSHFRKIQDEDYLSDFDKDTQDIKNENIL